jgi:5-methylcytosine-specific restriction enzyme subunit McrC
MRENESIVIREYSISKPLTLEDKDFEYLSKEIFHPEGRPTFEIRHNREGKSFIHNSSYAGILQLPSERVVFSTKVKTNLFYLLRFLKSEDAFLFDAEKIIDIEGGVNFFDIIGRLFDNELKEIIDTGLLKKYVQKSEDLKYLKGKLNIKHQLHHSMSGHPSFSCIYGDLTYDNLENQIVLRSLKELISLIQFDEELKEDLLRKEYLIRDIVSLAPIGPRDIDVIEYDRINEKYKTIIQLSKLILEETFIKSTEKGRSKGFNFIVNMNKVFEDFITQIVKEIIDEDKKYENFTVMGQAPFRSLDEEGILRTIPDIVIREKGSKDNYPLIIDTKYKTQENNADFYQVIAYALPIPAAKHTVLVYPKEGIEEKALTVNKNRFVKGDALRISVVGVDLKIEEDVDYDEYVNTIKKEVSDKVLELML